jgi:hypothetical protein
MNLNETSGLFIENELQTETLPKRHTLACKLPPMSPQFYYSAIALGLIVWMRSVLRRYEIRQIPKDWKYHLAYFVLAAVIVMVGIVVVFTLNEK